MITASPGELERVAQAVALAEGFQLLVLECERLPPDGIGSLLDEVQRRVAELRGVPPLIMVYEPRVTTDWVAEVLTPITELPGPATSGASLVAVIDGAEAAIGRARAEKEEHANWQFLFQRINERRNAITRSLPGTLMLALTPTLGRMFLEEAPDMASIRSGMFRLDPAALHGRFGPALAPVALKAWYPPALLREAALRRVVANRSLREADRDLAVLELQGGGRLAPELISSGEGHRRLFELILALFSPEELSSFVHFNYPELASSVLMGSSPATQVFSIIQTLLQQGRVDRGLFERMIVERPRRRDEVAAVAELWGHALGHPAASQRGHVEASDLHEALLRLSSSQREQIMYLAGFAGGELSMKVMRGLRERPPTSAREIFERARQGGAEGLARLAEAIEIVTAGT